MSEHRAQIALVCVHVDSDTGRETYEAKFVDGAGRFGDRLWISPDGTMEVAPEADEIEMEAPA